MREHKKEERTIQETVVTNVICNKCKKESTNETWGKSVFQEFHCSFGYGSQYDMETWSFDLCEDCLTDLIKTFEVVPYGWSTDNYAPPFSPQASFDKWKATGEWDMEAGMTPEEIDANGGSIYAEDPSEES